MVGWHRQLGFVLRGVGKRVDRNYGLSNHFSTSSSTSSLLSGKVHGLPGIWNSTSATVSRPLYQFLQQIGIASTRNLMAEELKPVSSPLTPTLLTSGTGQTEGERVVDKKASVQAILKGIKQSPKKVNLVAEFVRGMLVKDALMQLQVTVKRAAKTVFQVIHSARANATHNHGLDADRLLVGFKKRIFPHAKGKHGIRVRAECRLTVVVRETTPEEETKIARLRVHNFKKRTKREKRLVPHTLIETTPYWKRKSKDHRGEANHLLDAIDDLAPAISPNCCMLYISSRMDQGQPFFNLLLLKGKPGVARNKYVVDHSSVLGECFRKS